MANKPTPPRGWRLVDKTKDVRTENTPVAVWHANEDDGVWLCCDGGDKWYDEFYAVPSGWPFSPPTINDIPWITDRLPTEEDGCSNGIVLAFSDALKNPVMKFFADVREGDAWIPLNKQPPPKREPIEGWVNVYADGVGAGLYRTKEEADFCANELARLLCIKVREVMEDEQ